MDNMDMAIKKQETGHLAPYGFALPGQDAPTPFLLRLLPSFRLSPLSHLPSSIFHARSASPRLSPETRNPNPETRFSLLCLLLLLCPLAFAASPAASTLATAAGASFQTRSAAARQLAAGTLADSDIDTLVKFLLRPLSSEPGLSEAELGSLKNDTAAVLSRAPNAADRLLGALAESALAPSTDPTWRDYSLQFLAIWVEAADKEKLAALENSPNSPIQILARAATRKTDPVSGTAVIQLARLAGKGLADKSAAAKLAVDTAADSSANICSRISALQACAQLNAQPGLATARDIAANPAEPVLLRIPATAVIAALGSTQDRATLETLSKTADPRLANAAKSNLAALRARLDSDTKIKQ